MKISYQVTVGSTTYTEDSTSQLRQLQMSATFPTPVNSCRLALNLSDSPSLQPGDAVTVALGYNGDRTLVFTGQAQQIIWGIRQVQIEAESSFRALTVARFNRLYETSTAGAIVSDLAAELGISLDQVDDGIQFPVYAIGDRQTVYSALQTLSNQCGVDFYANSADKLVFRGNTSSPLHRFEYGVNILDLQGLTQPAAIAGVEVYGESPASQGQGNQAVSWLTKQEVKGNAGSTSGTVRRLIDPTARTQAIANRIAQAELKARSKQQQGTLKVLGNPAVQLGDRVQIANMPNPSQNGTFKVTGIKHDLNHTQGFYSTIYWEEA